MNNIPTPKDLADDVNARVDKLDPAAREECRIRPWTSDDMVELHGEIVHDNLEWEQVVQKVSENMISAYRGIPDNGSD